MAHLHNECYARGMENEIGRPRLHVLSEINTEDRAAVCARCGPVRIHPGLDGNAWRCGRRSPDRLALGAKLSHVLSEINEELHTATCARCGLVRLYWNRGSIPGWSCGRKPPERAVGGPKVSHILTEIDEVQRTALCSICGPVKAYPNPKTGKVVCLMRKYDAGKAAKHRISNVDEAKKLGDCAACGPLIKVSWSTRFGGYGYWHCNHAGHAGHKAWEDRATHRRALHSVSTTWRKRTRAQLASAQAGICGICKQKVDRMCIDHDHVTNRVRGGLCSSCNIGLGGLKDSIELLKAAIAYLEDHKLHEAERPLVPAADHMKKEYKFWGAEKTAEKATEPEPATK